MASEERHGLHIAIVGAGIAGLALAIGLHKHGLPFTLYEEAPQHSAVGAGIGFGPNGLLAMDLLESRFRSKYEAVCVGNRSRVDANVFFEGLLCREGLEKWYGHSCWGAEDYRRKSAHRRELLDILTSFIPNGCVQFSKRLVRIEQQDDHVLLHFADGDMARAAALIGADGIQSLTREHVLQLHHHNQVRPVYAHSYAYRAVIPMTEARDVLGDLTDTAKVYLGDNRCIITYRVSGGDEFNYLHCVFKPGQMWPSSDLLTEKVTEAAKDADFADRKIDERLLRLLAKAPPVRWGLFHHVQTSTHFRGLVVLAGDSAHASLPYQAAGAGQGVEDALILSELLGAMNGLSLTQAEFHDHLLAAFHAYDNVRRPRAQRQTEQSLEISHLLSFQDPQAGSDMNKILSRLQHGWFDWLWFHDPQVDVKLARDVMNSTLSSQRAGD